MGSGRLLSLASAAALTASWVTGAGCGRSELDEAYQFPAAAPRDAGGQAADVGAPSTLVDAASPAPDAAIPFDVAPRSGPLSCQMPGRGISDCGPAGEDCCMSLEVPGGKYVRSYDGVSCPGGVLPAAPAPALGCYLTPDHPATISGFRLDKYLVTVARFKTFLASIRASGWRPTADSGRHTHLNGGRGLADVGVPGTFETGWNDTWNDATLTADPGDNDNTIPEMSINGVTWAQAYAFCIWDGGFLPSEAEWNYAAAGGDEQRVYPWSTPPKDTSVNCAHAAYTQVPDPDACVLSGAYYVGAKSPTGDSRWGQADMAGLRGEWTLDWLVDYIDPCVDCVNMKKPPGGMTTSRAVRGYAHVGDTAPPRLLTSLRGDDSFGWNGFRCARSP